MPISTGGVVAEGGLAGHYLSELTKRVAAFAPRTDDSDYVVDIAFRSWWPSDAPEFVGVKPGMVGRKQRRVIIWHSVPQKMEDADAVRHWFCGALHETERLLREWLPSKARSYPSEDLAQEVAALRATICRDT